MYKQNVKESEKQALVKERNELYEAVKAYNEKLEVLKAQEEVRRKKHQDDLLWQIERKKQIQNQENQDKLYNERAAKMWEADLTQKLQVQKDIHKKRVIIIINNF